MTERLLVRIDGAWLGEEKLVARGVVLKSARAGDIFRNGELVRSGKENGAGVEGLPEVDANDLSVMGLGEKHGAFVFDA